VLDPRLFAPTPRPTGYDDGDRPAADRASDPTHGAVVVLRGDTLWSIARRHLVATGHPAPTDTDIDAEWRRWYAANRAVIGADPDLILPGQRLAPPVDPS
jgi:nucleoid-associated protein YgaU